jgi:hypothetical protein
MELLPKETLFVQAYLTNGYNGRQAYMTAYETDNKNVASVEACKMLKKEKIKKALDNEEGGFKDLARQYGADKLSIVKKLVQHINSEDEKTSISAINTLAKLTGDFAPEKKDIKIDDEYSHIDIAKLDANELEDMKKALLGSM